MSNIPQPTPSTRISFFIPRDVYRHLQMHAIMQDLKLNAFIREKLTEVARKPLIEKP